ncbi:uncharacterized protein UTRI_00313 [Ustilago trichophora]|uniref:Uncharacterized protein n=1 Tax=Ustilago trichophora TaxID=86804 RepID=A0A5C3DUK0_9BASI|nr:uncharacterized protein UTRI_00313 [Ustilago trichophora]
MQSAGGFIIDDLSTIFAGDNGGSGSHQSATQLNDTNNDYVPDSVATPKPLSSKQEAKLRSYLDGALEDITRGYRKRFDPSSSLHTLSSYLAEWIRLLGVLAHVPPYGSGSTNLLISYLLRCSTDLADGITGYSLAMEMDASRRQRKRQKRDQGKASGKDAGAEADDDDEGSDSDQEEERQHQTASRTKQLNLALQTLDLLDRMWAAVLRGNLINLPVALSNARKAFPDSTDGDTTTQDQQRSHQPYNPRTLHSTSSLAPSPAIDGRFVSGASVSTSVAPRESLPIHGGRGNRTVGVTDQVRLRNIAISSREKLFSWMRAELDAPAPPVMDEHDPEQEPPDNTVEGALGIKQDPETAAAPAEDADDRDFEDVEIDAERNIEEGYDAEDDTEEHKHYQDLFDRKLDPDADDDDDDEDGPADVPRNGGDGDDGGDGVESDQKLAASVLGTVEAVTSQSKHDKRKHEDELLEDSHSEFDEPRADGLPSKRPRASSTDAEQTEDGKMSRSEMGSINFNLSDAIGQWDLSFTRLFSRTLRTLSDLSDFAKRGAKSDFNSSLAGISGADEQEPADDRN